MGSAVGIDLALGLVGVGIGVFPMLQDWFSPKKEDSVTTIVKIIVGDGVATDGNQPGVHLFDRQGMSIGVVPGKGGDGDKIHRGQPRDIEVVQYDPDSAANSLGCISITPGGNDAIWISMITVTTPTAIKSSWTGNIAYTCGVPSTLR